MFADNWFLKLNPQGKDALVLATGGGADIVLAQFVANRLIALGAKRVDIAQPLNTSNFSPDIIEQYKLTEPIRTGLKLLYRLPGGKPNDGVIGTRGKGISMAAAVNWKGGNCLLVAAQKGSTGAIALARREWEPMNPYGLAIAVDGGGDILTGGPEEFDRVVLDVFQTAWGLTRPLALLVVGLGADGHDWTEEKAREMDERGWILDQEAPIDQASAESLIEILQSVNRLHPDPLNWRHSDEHWSHGLHVPQIVALAAQGRLPLSFRKYPWALVPRFKRNSGNTEIYPPTGEDWLVLNEELLTQARWYLCNQND